MITIHLLHIVSPYCFLLAAILMKGKGNKNRAWGRWMWLNTFGGKHTPRWSLVSRQFWMSMIAVMREGGPHKIAHLLKVTKLISGKLGGDPAPPDAQAHIVLSRICSWSKAPGLLSARRALSCPSLQKFPGLGMQGCRELCPQSIVNHVPKPTTACCNIASFSSAPMPCSVLGIWVGPECL